MSTSKILPLRVLYTINSSPQYILARSHCLVPVSLVPHHQSYITHNVGGPPLKSDSEPRYATVSLRTCLDTICRSSPELVQDNTRDFSVYVLDPLESNSAPAPVHISSSPTGPDIQPSQSRDSSGQRGVAVGLGLMSWAMLAEESDSVSVAGTLMKLGSGQDALEVVFALREVRSAIFVLGLCSTLHQILLQTAPMQRASLPAALRSWGLPPDGATQLNHFSKQSFSNVNSYAQSTSTTTVTHFKRDDTSVISSMIDASTASIYQSPGNKSPSSTLAPAPAASTLATLTSIHKRTQVPKLKLKATKSKRQPITEAEKLMDVSETYIGPLKKKGRPKGPATGIPCTRGITNAFASSSGTRHDEEDVTLIDGKNVGNTLITSTSTSAVSLNSGSTKAQPSTTSLIRVEPKRQKETEPVSLLDILAFISASSSSNEPSVQNAALLAALSAIDSSSGIPAPAAAEGEINPVLVNALKQLLSACAQQSRSAAPTEDAHKNAQTPTQPNPHSHQTSPGEDIIILDKENVNPTAFKRRTDREREDVKLLGSSSAPALGGLDAPFSETARVSVPALAHHGRTTRSLGLSLRSNEGSAIVTTARSPLLRSGNGTRRKRTLSDFMEEREAAGTREGDWAERRDAYRYARSAHTRSSSSSETSGLRHYPRLVADSHPRRGRVSTSYYRTGAEPWTSPPRAKPGSPSPHGNGNEDGDDDGSGNENENRSGTSQLQPISVPDSPRAPRVFVSSPIRPSAARAETRRPYIVPQWARTNTATQPRLSRKAQRALEEAEERKKEEREAGKKRKAAHARMQEKARQKGKRAVGRDEKMEQPGKQGIRSLTVTRQIVQPGPVAASSDGPIFASLKELSASCSSSTPSSRSPSRSLTRRMIRLPSTPPRKRRAATCSSEGGESGSLFTPTPKARGVATSPLFSPQLGSWLSTSPLRDGKTMSPIQAIIPGENLNSQLARSADNKEEQEYNANETDGDLEDALNRELDTALDDLDFPSCSLPVASSDFDDAEIPPLDDAETTDQCSEDDQVRERALKQHWSGLPPSSPPPPTSPVLLPKDTDPESDLRTDEEDLDDLELPWATSDADDSAPTSPTLDIDFLDFSSAEPAVYSTVNDFSSLFPPHHELSNSHDITTSEMDVFDQFTNHNHPSDGERAGENLDFNPEGELESLFHNGLADFDFTEFWETFKPLVQDQTASNDSDTQPGLSSDFGQVSDPELNVAGELDHAKLAEDVYALFSGCLV